MLPANNAPVKETELKLLIKKLALRKPFAKTLAQPPRLRLRLRER
jgi:hypothetical protein